MLGDIKYCFINENSWDAIYFMKYEERKQKKYIK